MDEQLELKVMKELEEFRQTILKRDKEAIYDSHARIHTIEDLAGVLLSTVYTEGQMEVLLETPRLLEKLADSWGDEHIITIFLKDTVERFLI